MDDLSLTQQLMGQTGPTPLPYEPRFGLDENERYASSIDNPFSLVSSIRIDPWIEPTLIEPIPSIDMSQSLTQYSMPVVSPPTPDPEIMMKTLPSIPTQAPISTQVTANTPVAASVLHEPSIIKAPEVRGISSGVFKVIPSSTICMNDSIVFDPKGVILGERGKYQIEIKMTVDELKSKGKQADFRLVISRESDNGRVMDIPMIKISVPGIKTAKTMLTLDKGSTFKLTQISYCNVKVSEITMSIEKIESRRK